MPRFGRVLSAMVTPFDDDGALDLDVAAELARYLQDHGHDGLVVAGTTGEAPVLTDDERLSLFAAVIEAVTIPVVAGTGTNDTAPLGAPDARRRRRSAPPASSRSARTTTVRRRPASRPTCGRSPRRATCPVMVYDIPVRTGRKITTATLLRLFREVPNIVGPQGCRRQPGRDGGPDQLGTRRVRGLQRRRRDDAAARWRAASSARSASRRTGPAPTTSRCSTCGRRATSSAPGSSTAACSRASRSRPATTRRTRSRPRR